MTRTTRHIDNDYINPKYQAVRIKPTEQVKKARQIHQVDYSDMDTAVGALRAIGLGFLAWFLLMAVVIGVMAVWP
jgi:hypothetical protein